MRAGYVSNPIVEMLPWGPVIVRETLRGWSEEYKRWFEVEVGYQSDLLTVPWWARWLIPKAGPGRNEAILHDWFCDNRPPGISSYAAARIFREFLIASRIKKWRRRALYTAVRLGGPRWPA